MKSSIQNYAETILKKANQRTIKKMTKIPFPEISTLVGEEEELTVILSDWQLGHKTRSFNLGVAKTRVEELCHSIATITEIQRKDHPVKNINVFLEGDFVQNEAVGYLVDLSELEAILIDQVFGYAVPYLAQTIEFLGKNFENVNVWSCRGNHGRGDRQNSEKTNWDDVIYRSLDLMFKNTKRIKFNLTQDFYNIATIMGWNYLLAHGDQVRGGSYGIPLYALLQRMLRWATSLPEKWDVLCCGHWHNFAYLEQNNQFLIVNGTLVSDDDYVRKQYGWNCSTSQVIFGVHKNRPITSLYRIDFRG